jgi:PD-(D/E)XK nuclease superfamily protein
VVRNTHSLGDRTEAIVMAQLLQRYESVLIPFGNGRRYDLVVEEGGIFTRIQCKTGRLRNGAVEFNTTSMTYLSGKSASGARRSRDYRGDADLFGVYCPATGKVYLVPVDEMNAGIGYLRIDPARNNQTKGVRWAHDYELRSDSPL